MKMEEEIPFRYVLTSIAFFFERSPPTSKPPFCHMGPGSLLKTSTNHETWSPWNIHVMATRNPKKSWGSSLVVYWHSANLEGHASTHDARNAKLQGSLENRKLFHATKWLLKRMWIHHFFVGFKWYTWEGVDIYIYDYMNEHICNRFKTGHFQRERNPLSKGLTKFSLRKYKQWYSADDLNVAPCLLIFGVKKQIRSLNFQPAKSSSQNTQIHWCFFR